MPQLKFQFQLWNKIKLLNQSLKFIGISIDEEKNIFFNLTIAQQNFQICIENL
jgi:hypothetical protein